MTSIIAIISFLLSLFSPSSIIAAEITPTPGEPTKTTSSFEDIQKIREVVQEKVKEKLKQITTFSPAKKGFIGTVVQAESDQITIDYQNKDHVLSVSTDTVIIDSNRNKTKIDKVKIGQEILAMGTINSNGILETKRIVFIDLKSLENKYQTIVGKIVDISQSTSIFVLIPNNNKNTQYQIKTDSKTEFSNPKNTKKIDLKNLKSGQKVVVVIKPDEKITKTFYVTKIIDLDSQNTASPSATPTATKQP